MRVVRVPLGERAYSIRIGEGLLCGLGQDCQRLGLGRHCTIISDSNVAPLYARRAAQSLERAGFEPRKITIPAGETAKCLARVSDCYHELARHRAGRDSFIVALGGGVVGDLAGFVAATYLRGLPLVQVPTTLLAQVDSSVGGKVGVNLDAGKNLVGAFHQPRLVVCDLTTLETLPPRELRAGFAEVFKYGSIADTRLFRRLERDVDRLLQRDGAALAAVGARCCAIKAAVVGQDETEQGRRAVLNFGHTVGHALEAVSGYGKYLHGEAIAIGQVFAARLSARLLGLPEADVHRIRSLFERAGLPTDVCLSRRQREGVSRAMRLDKKTSAGEIRFVLAERIGRVVWGRAVPASVIGEVFDVLSGRPSGGMRKRDGDGSRGDCRVASGCSVRGMRGG